MTKPSPEFAMQMTELEEKYKESQNSSLAYWQAKLLDDDSSNAIFHYSKESIQFQIDRINALFAVYQMLLDAGYPVSFVGLTHTMQAYSTSVIFPMKEMLENGQVEEAVALYKQPRRYHR